MGLASEMEGEVCGGEGWVRMTKRVLMKDVVWGRRSACLVCLLRLDGARWPSNAPVKAQRVTTWTKAIRAHL